MPGSIVLFYAALLTLLLVALSLRVVTLRRRHRVGIGSGKIKPLERAVRAHANFCEYVPIALILLLLIEWSGEVPVWALHFLGLTLLVGRVLHGVGLNQTEGASRGRFIGTLLTWSMMLIGSGLALGMSMGRLT